MEELEKNLLEVAKTVPHNTASSQTMDPGGGSGGKPVTKRDIRCAPNQQARRELKSARRRAYRAWERERGAVKASKINFAERSVGRKVPDELGTPGHEVTADRPLWLEEVQRYLMAKYRDDDNTVADQRARRTEVRDMCHDMTEREWDPLLLTDWELVKARGQLSRGTGVGADGCPNELWRAVPWNVMQSIKEVFNVITQGSPTALEHDDGNGPSGGSGEVGLGGLGVRDC